MWLTSACPPDTSAEKLPEPRFCFRTDSGCSVAHRLTQRVRFQAADRHVKQEKVQAEPSKKGKQKYSGCH
ncbi:hypothetical protein F7725_009238 [Dissostichus mawsoni]|uniref:Uncharacterized protein n=1 Tax=Dissostichus mawsoni TaxID=36200 RepID=A0A7J5Z8G2_DISMA|nr:hypothetical protein F7725_009238 [Dissostichus mawsoni]